MWIHTLTDTDTYTYKYMRTLIPHTCSNEYMCSDLSQDSIAFLFTKAHRLLYIVVFFSQRNLYSTPLPRASPAFSLILVLSKAFVQFCPLDQQDDSSFPLAPSMQKPPNLLLGSELWASWSQGWRFVRLPYYF